jgi:hypothetical protein
LPQSWLRKQLDRYVRKRSVDDKIGQAAKLLLLTGVLFLMTGVIAWAEEGQFDLIKLSLGAIYVFVGLWDYLVYRHKLNLGELPADVSLKDVQVELTTREEAALPSSYHAQLEDAQADTRPLNIIEEPTQRLRQDADLKR